MSASHQKRIVELQRALKIARTALERIQHGARDAEGVAEAALDEISKIECNLNPTPPGQREGRLP